MSPGQKSFRLPSRALKRSSKAQAKVPEPPYDTAADARVYIGEKSPDDPPPELLLGISFLELFILAIISANPVDNLTDVQRLDRVLKLLLCKKKSRAILDQRDQPALTYMMAQRHEDERNLSLYNEKKARGESVSTFTPKKRNDSELAGEAARQFLPHETQRTAANRLREKFSGAYDRKQGKLFDGNSRSTYDSMVHYDYLEAARNLESLKLVRDEFAKHGLSMDLHFGHKPPRK